MEIIQNFTSQAATWYKYQPGDQMGSVYIKSSKVGSSFCKRVEFYGIKILPPDLKWPQILSCHSGLISLTG